MAHLQPRNFLKIWLLALVRGFVWIFDFLKLRLDYGIKIKNPSPDLITLKVKINGFIISILLAALYNSGSTIHLHSDIFYFILPIRVIVFASLSFESPILVRHKTAEISPGSKCLAKIICKTSDISTGSAHHAKKNNGHFNFCYFKFFDHNSSWFYFYFLPLSG